MLSNDPQIKDDLLKHLLHYSPYDTVHKATTSHKVYHSNNIKRDVALLHSAVSLNCNFP